MVDSQLKTLIAEGIETLNVKALKIIAANGDWPLTNMWCPQTRNPSNAMAIELYAMNR